MKIFSPRSIPNIMVESEEQIYIVEYYTRYIIIRYTVSTHLEPQKGVPQSGEEIFYLSLFFCGLIYSADINRPPLRIE